MRIATQISLHTAGVPSAPSQSPREVWVWLANYIQFSKPQSIVASYHDSGIYLLIDGRPTTPNGEVKPKPNNQIWSGNYWSGTYVASSYRLHVLVTCNTQKKVIQCRWHALIRGTKNVLSRAMWRPYIVEHVRIPPTPSAIVSYMSQG